ncbi:hypothetical protein C8J57DRAFT_1573539 [Mycena rebaudengoi]|nr:hypothetical protein C8J57DRAFT_1573539 [Mycena rebaudengoi]
MECWKMLTLSWRLKLEVSVPSSSRLAESQEAWTLLEAACELQHQITEGDTDGGLVFALTNVTSSIQRINKDADTRIAKRKAEEKKQKMRLHNPDGPSPLVVLAGPGGRARRAPKLTDGTAAQRPQRHTKKEPEILRLEAAMTARGAAAQAERDAAAAPMRGTKRKAAGAAGGGGKNITFSDWPQGKGGKRREEYSERQGSAARKVYQEGGSQASKRNEPGEAARVIRGCRKKKNAELAALEDLNRCGGGEVGNKVISYEVREASEGQQRVSGEAVAFDAMYPDGRIKARAKVPARGAGAGREEDTKTVDLLS